MLVLCNGMNRSGSTLQYNLVRGLVEKSGTGQGEGFLLPEQFGEAAPRLEDWARDSQWHLVKTHQLPPQTMAMVSAGTIRICYIYRDIREVAASYKRLWQTPTDKLYTELDQAITNYYAIHALPPHACICQRYERVTTDLLAATHELALFLGISPSEKEIFQIAKACSADEMQKATERLTQKLRFQSMLNRLLRRGLRLVGGQAAWRSWQRKKVGQKRQIDPQTLLHPHHLSQVNEPESTLTPIELTTITQRYRTWLQETGYHL